MTAWDRQNRRHEITELNDHSEIYDCMIAISKNENILIIILLRTINEKRKLSYNWNTNSPIVVLEHIL